MHLFKRPLLYVHASAILLSAAVIFVWPFHPTSAAAMVVSAEPSATPKKRSAPKPAITPAPPTLPPSNTNIHLRVNHGESAVDFRLDNGSPALGIVCGVTNGDATAVSVKSTGSVVTVSGLKDSTTSIILTCNVSNGSATITITSIAPEFAATPVPVPVTIADLMVGGAAAPPIKMRRRSDPAIEIDELVIFPEDSQTGEMKMTAGDVFTFTLPACVEGVYQVNAAGDSQQATTCYELVSSNPKAVSVVDGQALFVVGRGDADIIIREVGRVELTRKATGVKTLISSTPGRQVYFPLRRGAKFTSLRIRAVDSTDSKIVAIARLKPYKAVSEEYGRGIAGRYMVIAVDINNAYAGKQFLVQNVSVNFNPNQCNELKVKWARAAAGDAAAIPDSDQKRNDCLEHYDDYFNFPVDLMPSDANTMLAVNEAQKYRSWRYWAFGGARFAADVGTGLEVFKIGKNVVRGFSFLGTTLFTSGDGLWPKVADKKRENLEKDLPKSNIIVKGNDSSQVTLFIPISHVLSKKGFALYKQSVKDVDEQIRFNQYMVLFLIANSSGILIDENSQKVNSDVKPPTQ